MANITVPFEEADGSGANTFGADGGSGTRILFCEYDDAGLLSAQLLGGAIGETGGIQYREAPARHPDRPFLYARAASYEGIGPSSVGPSGAASYPKARVRVEYRPLERDEIDDPDRGSITYITESRDLAGQFVTLPSEQFEWVDGPDTGEAVGEGTTLGRLLPELAVTLRVHQWFAAPVTEGTFEQAIGKVNDEDFRALWTNWGAETLLFEGASAEREYTSDGIAAWRVTLSFRYRSIGWNAFQHPSGQFFEVETSTGVRPYSSMDFATLLP